MFSTKKVLLVNFSALSAVQVANYIIPLIVLPYLVRVIGPERFGILAFAQAVVLYFTLISDLGTNLYAPREIAILKDKKEALSDFVSGLLTLKTVLFVCGVSLYALAVILVPRFRDEWLVFCFSAGYILANTFMPVWFFQGIEKMVSITVCILGTRLLSMILIFIMIREAHHYVYVPLINSGGSLAGVILLFVAMYFKEGVRLKRPNMQQLQRISKESFPLFISNVAISTYSGINTVILGFLTSDAVVGYYSAAEKLIKAGMGLQAQLGNVLYPHISRVLSQSWEDGLRSIRMGLVATMLLAIPAAIFVIGYADPIVQLMFGAGFQRSIMPLRIMGVLFFVIGLSNVFGIQTLLPLGRRDEIMRPTVAAGIFNLILVIFIAPKLAETGAALAFLGAECLVTGWMFIVVKRLKLQLISGRMFVKLLGLMVGLCVSMLVLKNLDLNLIFDVLGFCLCYMVLVYYLKIVDIHTRTIAT